MGFLFARSGAAALFAGFLAISLAACGSGGSGSSNATVALNETGSSLLYPLFNIWVPAYTGGKHVTISTAATGSGTGISDAISGTVQIGASDAYMSNAQVAGAKTMLNVPLAISAQQIMYNLPGIAGHLQISGPILAGIYSGSITSWDNPEIAAANPSVRLPSLRIVPIHRTDSSGDTFLFSQYLSFSNPSTWGGPGGPSYGTQVSWPSVQGSLSATGNAGMLQALGQNQGGIAYVGISYLSQGVQAGLGYAALKNASGSYVLPTKATISAAAKAKFASTPKNERVSLIFAEGKNSYPIINYEYAIVNRHQPTAAVAKAIRDFLNWAVSPTGGNSQKYLAKVHFLELPASVVRLSQMQISRIQ